MNFIYMKTSRSQPCFHHFGCVYVRDSFILQQEKVTVGDKTFYRDKGNVHLAYGVVELPCLSETHVFLYAGSCRLYQNWNLTTVTQGYYKVRTTLQHPVSDSLSM